AADLLEVHHRQVLAEQGPVVVNRPVGGVLAHVVGQRVAIDVYVGPGVAQDVVLVILMLEGNHVRKLVYAGRLDGPRLAWGRRSFPGFGVHLVVRHRPASGQRRVVEYVGFEHVVAVGAYHRGGRGAIQPVLAVRR